MAIEHILNGYKIISDSKGVHYIPTVEQKFNDLYRVKHFSDFLSSINDKFELYNYFDKKEKVFEQYCKICFKKNS